MVITQGRSPRILVFILGPVGPAGTLATEQARQDKFKKKWAIFKIFSAFLNSGRNPAWLAWSSGAPGPTGPNISTFDPGLLFLVLVHLYSLVITINLLSSCPRVSGITVVLSGRGVIKNNG